MGPLRNVYPVAQALLFADVELYMASHRIIHRKNSKADPTRANQASNRSAHMPRLLDSIDEFNNLGFPLAQWVGRSIAIITDVHKVGDIIIHTVEQMARPIANQAHS